MATGQMEGVVRRIRKLALQDAPGITDSQLLESFLIEKNEASFEALVRRHGPMVLAVCRRVLKNLHDAEDAFQATFLVLVRKSASIGRRELLGNWLYGVAYRTAMKSRGVSRRRRAKERQLANMPQKQTPADAASDELLSWLDQELNSLPEKYRAPVVLCDLEGKSRKEAAHRLGWPIGTLNWRLAYARTILAKRLTRRGVALGGGALAMALSTHASASVPISLVTQTVKAGTLISAEGAVTASLVSVKVASLAEGVVKAMFLAKLKVGVMVLVATALIGASAGLFSYGALTTGEPAAQDQGEPRQTSLTEGPVPDQKDASFRTANFLVDAPTPTIARRIGEAAENYLITLSETWLGQELPQWSDLCPIHVKLTPASSHSYTSLEIANGKITAKQITLKGPLERLLKGDLPREIAHVILAHHFGCLVPRWADEGVAISSSEAEINSYEKALQEVLGTPGRFIPLRRLFGFRDYPADAMALRTEGYSLTRFLVEAKDPQVFLEFVAQGMREGWNKAANNHYGYLDVVAMEAAWLQHVRQATQTTKAGVLPNSRKSRLSDGPVYIDDDGKTHPYYTLVWKLIRFGLHCKEEMLVPNLILADGTHSKLFFKDRAWRMADGTRDQDAVTASTVLEVSVTDRPSGTVRLKLDVQDNDEKKSVKGDTLVVGSNHSLIREVEVGKELRLVLAEDDNGSPKLLLELTLNSGVAKHDRSTPIPAQTKERR